MSVALEICAAKRQPIHHDDQVREGMELVRAVVRQVRASLGRLIPEDDMISFGNEGLVDAMIRFDPERGIEFKTYASQRIRGSIIDGMRREGLMPRRAWERASEQFDCQAGPVEFDEALHSLDDAESPEEAATRTQEAEAVLEAIEELAPEQAELVRRFYGAGDSLQQISEDLGYAPGWGSKAMEGVHDAIRRQVNPHQVRQSRRTQPCEVGVAPPVAASERPAGPETGRTPPTRPVQTEFTRSNLREGRLKCHARPQTLVLSRRGQGNSPHELVFSGPCQGHSPRELILAGPCQGHSPRELILAGPCQGHSLRELILAGPCQGHSHPETIRDGRGQGSRHPEAIRAGRGQGSRHPEAIRAGRGQGSRHPEAIRAGMGRGSRLPEALGAGMGRGSSLPEALGAGMGRGMRFPEAIRAGMAPSLGESRLLEQLASRRECSFDAIRRPLRPIGAMSAHQGMPTATQSMRSVMKNIELVDSILANPNMCASALDRVLPEARAMRPARVRRLNVDVPKLVSRVLAAAPAVLSMREEIEKQTPLIPIASLEKLELYAYALQEAHIRCLAVGKPSEELRALSAEGESSRSTLRSDCLALIGRGLIDSKSLASCQGQPGYKTIATDLGILASVMLSHWPEIEGKTGVTMQELQRARALSQALLAYAGGRDICAQDRAAASDLRDRIFTLLVQNYQIARRVVGFLRFDQGDAESITPSLFGGRKRHARKAEPAHEEKAVNAPSAPATVNAPSEPAAVNAPSEPAAVNAPSAPATVNAPSAPAAVNGPVGTPNSNPFMN